MHFIVVCGICCMAANNNNISGSQSASQQRLNALQYPLSPSAFGMASTGFGDLQAKIKAKLALNMSGT